MQLAMLGSDSVYSRSGRYNYPFAPQAYMHGDSEQPATMYDYLAQQQKSESRQRFFQNVLQGMTTVGKTAGDLSSALSNAVDSLKQQYPSDQENIDRAAAKVANMSWFERNQTWVIAGIAVIGVALLASGAVRVRRRRRRR